MMGIFPCQNGGLWLPGSFRSRIQGGPSAVQREKRRTGSSVIDKYRELLLETRGVDIQDR